jgi:tRNA (cytidine56-2'-O)-methyltransferase
VSRYLKDIIVLRMGHRGKRDPRLSTHVALAARAFGAAKMLFSGDKDPKLVQSIEKVTSSWGGTFSAQHVKSWKRFLTEWETFGKSVQLTMYGLNVFDVVGEIRSYDQDLLVIVGGQKVPRDVYEMVDWNVSITNQPHSEVSALAVFLHILLGGNEFQTHYPSARTKIIPSIRGKKVLRNSSPSSS